MSASRKCNMRKLKRRHTEESSNIIEKGQWKPVELDTNLLSDGDFESFMGLEVLTDYEVSGVNHRQPPGLYSSENVSPKTTLKLAKKKNIIKTKTENSSEAKLESEQDSDVLLSKKAKLELKGQVGAKEVAKRRIKKTPKQKIMEEVKRRLGKKPRKNVVGVNMSAWKDMRLPNVLLKAVADQGFTKPTPIQSETIPTAINSKIDIIGAAETGSGKTLAFGLPVLSHILRIKSNTTKIENLAEKSADDQPGTFEDMPTGSEGISTGSDEVGLVHVEDDIENEDWMPRKKVVNNEDKSFMSLILTPTRELAVQVAKHLKNAAKYTDIKIAVVVGGMAAEKQLRILKKQPEIIVATPGRLWELYETGAPYIKHMAQARFLVIDEADRMIEKGHYAELTNILDILNGSKHRSQRQTFVFSATLSLIHLGPNRKTFLNRYKTDKKEKLDSLMEKIGVRSDAKIFDLTRKQGTVETLVETKIVCDVNEKDVYLYYFLLQYPGRTLIFTNSIDCIRRLVSVFTILQCCPLPLHSSMHQRQRLKNLERFAANPKGVLLATDVAARGLDIPNVQHVIHYQVPRTSESYVHRSGRTARASKEGLSLMMVSPAEVSSFKRVCKTLNRDDLPIFPTEIRYLREVKGRVDAVRELETIEHRLAKKRHHNDWFIKAAKEIDVELDDDLLHHDLGNVHQQKQQSAEMKRMKKELAAMLQAPIFPRGASQLYLTAGGQLAVPFMQGSERNADALQTAKGKSGTEGTITTVQRKRKRRYKRK
ncbi:ATP-dependent RNA helicase DDX24-like [Anneissia japonica]|uniref:ATP-dependent RNA helicase DDX24-like n=1 Tax=Anneissia japonica TaxID=1529436 RepID=UPI0014259515|nr:ATP-dependent RNA helicase DDX24-like [Anneissia japonica]